MDQNLNREIEEIENNNIEIQEYEGIEGYGLKVTFDNNKFRKIQKLSLDLKIGKWEILDRIWRRERIAINEYHKIEKTIDVRTTQGTHKINLLTKNTVSELLSKISKKHSEKIQYVYLAGIQIMFKSLFREGIDSPLTVSLHDGRIINLEDGHLGTIEGNLAYQKLIFTCYPKYCVSLKDKNFNEVLGLHFKLHRNDIMEPGDQIMTMEYRALYTFTNSNYGNIYSNKPYIEIHKECKDISRIVEPNKQINIIPEEYEFNITKNKPEITESREEEDYKITFHNGRLIKKSKSLKLPNKKEYLGETSGIKEIKPHGNIKNMKIEGKYFNGRRYIKGPNILIDTGAGECHMAANKNEGLMTYKIEPYEYRNFDGQLYITELKVKVPIKIGGIDLLVPCYLDESMDIEPHILLGMSFLNGLEDYSIRREGLYITHKGQTTLCRIGSG